MSGHIREVVEFIIFDSPRIWVSGFLLFMVMLLAQKVIRKIKYF
jgi:hypothetical protein